jgi:integrase
MSIFDRNGTWNYKFQFHGKSYRKTTGLDATSQNVKDAKTQENDAYQRLKDGRQPRHEIVVREFRDGAKDFLATEKVLQAEHQSTYKRTKTSFASALQFFDRQPVSTIETSTIEAYMAYRLETHQVAGITLRHDLDALSKFFAHAIKHYWTRENPVDGAKRPSGEAERIYVISPAEEKLYFERAAHHHDLHDLGRLMLLQGMRPEEVTSLRKRDVSVAQNTLDVTGGKTSAAVRTLGLTDESRRILAARIEANPDSPWIFPASRNSQKAITRLNSAHDRLVSEAAAEGLDLGFVLYDFRHTFATRRATAKGDACFDLATLAAILGHASLRMVQKYVHPTQVHQLAMMRTFSQSLRGEEQKAKFNPGRGRRKK